MGAIVFGEIAQRDVLAVPGVVRKTERFLVQHFDEALRAATVLDIGRAGGGHGREERGVELGDERRKLRRHAIGKARRDAFFVARAEPRWACACRAAGGKTMSVLLVMARSVAREPGGAGVADWLRGGVTPPNSKMDRFASNDNTLSFE